MLARIKVLAVHSASEKLLHYVGMRVREANHQQTYRAGSFAPGSRVDAVILDLALIYDALHESAEDRDASNATFLKACFLASEELSDDCANLSGATLAERARTAHHRYLKGASNTLRGLSDAVDALLLRPFSSLGQLTLSQRRLRRDLSLVLALEAQVVRSSALSTIGVVVDLGTLVDDRDQHLYLFCDRYGCLNKAEFGDEPDQDHDQWESIGLPNDLVKRVLDIIVSLAIITLISPIFIFIFFIIKRESGPAFYNQKRIGLNGRLFSCWKFRTMVPNAEGLLEKILASDSVARADYAKYFKLRNDPRITRIGKFLRSTSLDELPQLFNVLIGDMALVGPRPIAADERDRWGSYFKTYKRMRPGLTGPWQLYFRSDYPYDQQFEHVVTYAQNWSLLLDLKYLLETLAVPFRRRGAY